MLVLLGFVATANAQTVSWCTQSFDARWSDGAFHTMVYNAFEAWRAASPCADLTFVDLQLCEEAPAGAVRFVAGDPYDLMAADLLVLTTYPGSGTNITINDDPPWSTDAEIAAHVCNGGPSIDRQLAQLAGEQLGLGLRDCTTDPMECDPTEVAAVLSNVEEGCTPTTFDSYAVRSLADEGAGPFTYAVSPFAGEAALPYEGCASVEIAATGLDAEDVAVSWNFGDGGTAAGTSVCHTFTAPGTYTVQTFFDWPAECGAWQERSVGHSTVCDVPAPAEGMYGGFSVENDYGLTYRIVNQLDTTVYGCITSIHWALTAVGSEEVLWSSDAWSPALTFPSPGDYRITLEAAGPGGTYSAYVELYAADSNAGSCSSSPEPASAPPLAALAALAGLTLTLRRRAPHLR